MKTIKFLLHYLFLTNVLIRIWALFFARSFYEDFPGLRFHWIKIMGRYNDHLIRDVGAYFLAMGTLALFALIKFELNRIQIASYVAIVFGVPHLTYHLMMIGMFSNLSDKVCGIITLSLPVLFPCVILYIVNLRRPNAFKA